MRDNNHQGNIKKRKSFAFGRFSGDTKQSSGRKLQRNKTADVDNQYSPDEINCHICGKKLKKVWYKCYSLFFCSWEHLNQYENTKWKTKI